MRSTVARRSRTYLLLLAWFSCESAWNGAQALSRHNQWGLLWVVLGGVTFLVVVWAWNAGPLGPARTPAGEVAFPFDLRTSAARAVFGLSWVTFGIVRIVRNRPSGLLWFAPSILGAFMITYWVDLARHAISKVPGLVVGPRGIDVSVQSRVVHVDWDDIDRVELSQSLFRPATLDVFVRDPRDVLASLPPRWQSGSRRSIERGGPTLFVPLSRLGLSRRSAVEGELASAITEGSGGRF
jgi:hypothetical protein